MKNQCALHVLQPHEDLMNASGLFPDDLSLNNSDVISATISTDGSGALNYSQMKSGGVGAGGGGRRRHCRRGSR